MIWF